MQLHVLNCGTLQPPVRGSIEVGSPWFAPGLLVSRCVLLESEGRLILIDSGLGLLDVAVPWHRLGPVFLAAWHPSLRAAECAAIQVENLGYQRNDVTDIVLTHLDPDCAGGLADFPDAVVHANHAELEAADHSPSIASKLRYRRAQWSHRVRWRRYGEFEERWFGLPATMPLPGLEADVRLIALPGHTAGHVGVAVRKEKQWLLHAGDAVASLQDLRLGDEVAPPRWRAWFDHSDPERWCHGVALLRRLMQERDDVTVVCSHDPLRPSLHGIAIPPAS